METQRILQAGVTLLALFAAVVPAAAQSAATPRPPGAPAVQISPEALAAAKELTSLISASMVGEMVKRISAEGWPSIEASLRAGRPTIDAATLADLRNEYERLMANNLSVTINSAPAIYASFFSAQEIRDLIAFYRTPLGRKTLTTMPLVNAAFIGVLMRELPALQQRTAEAFNIVLRLHGYVQ
jgi:hypothetical protein